jgi:hypothetical protein
MLFTWDTNNLCIIFHWWHIRSTFTLLISLLAIVFLTAGYEAIRSMTRRYESWVERQQGGSITRMFFFSFPLYPPISPACSTFIPTTPWNEKLRPSPLPTPKSPFKILKTKEKTILKTRLSSSQDVRIQHQGPIARTL